MKEDTTLKINMYIKETIQSKLATTFAEFIMVSKYSKLKLHLVIFTDEPGDSANAVPH